MAHYVVSDIHGESDRFFGMLDTIRFLDTDTLYILGDVVDRGPEGIGILQKIMSSSNMVMILGNHEHMMLEYLVPDPDPIAVRRWDKNGNGPTLEGFSKLDAESRRNMLAYLKSLPSHLEVEVSGKRFYLVHGFPGETVFEEVWSRPQLDTPNPGIDGRIILGHTPVQYLIRSEEERMRYLADVEARDTHLMIYHGDGFIDIDCACGHHCPVKALACIRLEDMAEFYI